MADHRATDPFLLAEDALTPDRQEQLLDGVFGANPNLRGADVADVLAIAHDADAYIVWTEPWYDDDANDVAVPSALRRVDAARSGERGVPTRLAAAVLVVAMLERRTPTVDEVESLLDAMAHLAGGPAPL